MFLLTYKKPLITNINICAYNNLGDKMFTIKQILNVAEELNVDFTKFPLSDFITGINIELEHGLIDPETNVTNNDLLKTAKIALAHLNEFPDYYNKEYGLPAFEAKLKEINKKNNIKN